MRITKRTKSELTVSEIIATYFVRNSRGIKFKRGNKPDSLPQNTVLSEKKLRSILHKQHKLNPITEARRYKQLIDARNNPSYQSCSEILGVSKARISQRISLLKNIPSEISNLIEKQSNQDFLCFFTERKLRTLTNLSTDREKIDAFRQMIDTFNKKYNGLLMF